MCVFCENHKFVYFQLLFVDPSTTLFHLVIWGSLYRISLRDSWSYYAALYFLADSEYFLIFVIKVRFAG